MTQTYPLSHLASFAEKPCFLFCGDHLIVKMPVSSESPIFPPTGMELLTLFSPSGPQSLSSPKLHFSNVFEMAENQSGFCAELPSVDGEKCVLAEPWRWLTLRQVARLSSNSLAFQAMGKAFQIIQWDKNHTFCGRCGQPTQKSAHERSRLCGQCGLSFFPRISPSIIVAIRRNDQILLARSAHFSPGVYSTLAGFIESGETAEQAVAREVQEEVGIRIHNLRYHSTQSWPFPDSLMLGYTADYLDGELQVDKRELEDAQWFHREQLPLLPIPASIAWQLIQSVLHPSQ